MSEPQVEGEVSNYDQWFMDATNVKFHGLAADIDQDYFLDNNFISKPGYPTLTDSFQEAVLYSGIKRTEEAKIVTVWDCTELLNRSRSIMGGSSVVRNSDKDTAYYLTETNFFGILANRDQIAKREEQLAAKGRSIKGWAIMPKKHWKGYVEVDSGISNLLKNFDIKLGNLNLEDSESATRFLEHSVEALMPLIESGYKGESSYENLFISRAIVVKMIESKFLSYLQEFDTQKKALTGNAEEKGRVGKKTLSINELQLIATRIKSFPDFGTEYMKNLKEKWIPQINRDINRLSSEQ